MTDKSVVFRKLTSLREHVTRMRRRRSDDLESFKLDTDRQDAIGMSLLVAVQDALDIALHMASDEGWGVAASYADSFGMLASNGVIDPALAAALANLATLRNRLAHGYGTVDMERIWVSLPDGLATLDAFASAIAARMGKD